MSNNLLVTQIYEFGKCEVKVSSKAAYVQGGQMVVGLCSPQ